MTTGVNTEEISVASYSGYRLNERPVRFKCQDKEFVVKKILASSVREFTTAPRRRYCFTVLCENNEEFSLFFDPQEDRWFLS